MNLSSEQQVRLEKLLYEVESEREFLQLFAQVEDKYELHELASSMNWDGGYFELNQVLNHPNLDKGTALLLYWYGEPEYFADYSDLDKVEDCNRMNGLFVKAVETKLLDDNFKSNSIRFDPIVDRGINKLQQKKLKENSGIPEALKVANI